jgi:hypothetical protein
MNVPVALSRWRNANWFMAGWVLSHVLFGIGNRPLWWTLLGLAFGIGNAVAAINLDRISRRPEQ